MAPPTGKTVWAVMPSGEKINWGGSLSFTFASVYEAGASELVVEGAEGALGAAATMVPVAVPGAFTAPALRGSCTPGAAVMFSCYAGHGGQYARLVQAPDGCEAHGYLGELTTKTVEGCRMIPLESTLAFGSPVAFRDANGWRAGAYIAAGATTGQAWVVDRGARLVDGPVPMQVTRAYKKGAAVWVWREHGAFDPASVTKVIDGGVAYVVRFKDNDTETVSFVRVTAPLQ